MNVLLIFYMAVTSRMAGGGFGAHKLPKQVTWLPEVLFSMPFGAIWFYILGPTLVGAGAFVIATAVSYIFMQSATWPALRWESHEPNLNRTATLLPISDWIADKFDVELGDEAYSWIYMGVKGFLITLPVGGVVGAILWPLGYELGSHAKGRVEKYGLDPHAFSELFAGAGAAISILILLGVL